MNTEYLRRNLEVAKAEGIRANSRVAIERLLKMKKKPVWMLVALEGIRDRAEGLPKELAQWRNTAPDAPSYVATPPASIPEPVADYAALIHYPEHWDTAAYPTLESAVREALAFAGCSACKDPEAYGLPASTRVALTLAQLNEAARDAQIDFCMDKESSFEVAFARRIERAHGISAAEDGDAIRAMGSGEGA